MSYGDETTSLDLADLGQVLITGEIQDDNSDGLRRSNGSGKSTIPNVILWALFGRTMHSANPGDSIINYYSEKECWARITFKNGDSITRTRGTKGHNELIYTKNGEEHTLSTSKNLQQLLNKDLKLDWELFTNSAFFTQYGRSWLEMADNSRKKALERILRVDRFTYYASSAKKGVESAEHKMNKCNTAIESHERNIVNQRNTIDKNEESKSNYEQSKQTRIESIKNSINRNNDKLNNIELPDIDKLSKLWEVYNKIQEKIEQMKSERSDIASQIKSKESNAQELKNKINNWNNKKGKQCLTCEQLVDDKHVLQHIEPYQESLEKILEEAKEYRQKYNALDISIKSAETKLVEKRPKMTVREARGIHNEAQSLKDAIERDHKWLKDVESEQNPYLKGLEDIRDAIKAEEDAIAKINEEKEQHEFLYRHYNFLYKAYSERSRIKSYVFKEHVPFINNRLNHYLDMLNLDVRVKLTENLGIESNMWGYDYQSGGERKRTDVAFMLAAFDFHEMMYGRQSNILVLDEVDGRMDDDGIDGLINIIKQELANKVETILIISHRNQMHDVFDKEIHVTKSDNCSRIKIN